MGITLAERYTLPALASVLLCLVFELFDTIPVGGLRLALKIPFPRTQGPVEFERVLRAQQNQAEQIPIFVISMWCCAVFFHADFAGGLGFLWIALRLCYTSTYRYSHQRSSLIVYTIPAYLIILAYISTSAASIIKQSYHLTWAQVSAGVAAAVIVLINVALKSRRAVIEHAKASLTSKEA